MVAAALAVVFVAHVRAYFFLLDDFVIIGEVTSHSAAALLSHPLFNFYRPVEHLWVKLLYRLFGWSLPGGYIALSLVLHIACAILVAAFVRLCTRDRRAALIAATLFLISPWGTEPFFWMSGGFDLIATAGLLAALVLGLAGLDAARTRLAAVLFACGVAAASVAMLAKEIGVLAPALFAATVVFGRGPRTMATARASGYTAMLLAAAAGYLVVRERLLPGLGGGYGALSTLVAHGSLARGAFSHARALVVLPFPSWPAIGPATPAMLLSLGFVGSVAVVAGQAVRTAPRLAALSIAGVGLSVAPVLWVSLIQGSSAGNRFLYFAGVWYVLLLAVGIARLGRASGAAAFLLVAGIGTGSVVHQARIWREASRLSRAAIDELRPYQGTARPLFVKNLPAAFTDGPYVINMLAYRYYFQGAMPPVAARAMTLKYDRGESTFAFWIDAPTPAPGAKSVTLSLPVWMDEPRPLGAIEAPHTGESLRQPFTVRGWAIDANARAREGTGIDQVHVYAYPRPDSDIDAVDVVFLGKARYGGSRPDVAQKYGARFDRSGFDLDASGLGPGRYRLAAFPRNARTRRAEAVWTGEVIVP